MTLSEVIRRAIVGDYTGDVDPNRFCYGGIIDTNAVAAAIRTWAAQEAQELAMAKAICEADGYHWEHVPETRRDWTPADGAIGRGIQSTGNMRADYRDAARAAGAALLGG